MKTYILFLILLSGICTAIGSDETQNNKPPVLNSITPSDFIIMNGNSVTFTAFAEDTENDPLVSRQ